MSAKYGGRFFVTREAIAEMLGLPKDIRIDLHFDYERNLYQVLMESANEVLVNGQPLTFPIEEGCMLPVVQIAIYDDEEDLPTPPQNRDVLDDFYDLLNE